MKGHIYLFFDKGLLFFVPTQKRWYARPKTKGMKGAQSFPITIEKVRALVKTNKLRKITRGKV